MNSPGSPAQKETPAAGDTAKGAKLTLELATVVSAQIAVPTQARASRRRRKTLQEHVDAVWREILRRRRHALCRAVKNVAIYGAPARPAYRDAYAALLRDERDAATRRKARR